MAAAAAVQGQFGAAGKCSSMLLQESKLGQQATPSCQPFGVDFLPNQLSLFELCVSNRLTFDKKNTGKTKLRWGVQKAKASFLLGTLLPSSWPSILHTDYIANALYSTNY